MTQENPNDKILAFARHIGERDRAPETIARERGWIDGSGRPTEAGEELLRALEEQRSEDAVYRLDP